MNVRVECLPSRFEVSPLGKWDELQPFGRRRLAEEPQFHFVETRLPGEERERCGMERFVVRQVRREVRERDETERVGRFGYEAPRGPELHGREFEDAEECRGRKMLEHMSTEDSAQRPVVERLKV